MKTATVGEIQKNFSKVLSDIKAGEEVLVTRHGKVVGKFIASGARKEIKWPDFMKDAVEVKGEPISQVIRDDRDERF